MQIRNRSEIEKLKKENRKKCFCPTSSRLLSKSQISRVAYKMWDLSVIFDTKVSFNDHIDYVTNEIVGMWTIYALSDFFWIRIKVCHLPIMTLINLSIWFTDPLHLFFRVLFFDPIRFYFSVNFR